MRDSLLMRLEPLRRYAAVCAAAWRHERQHPRLRGRTASELAFLPAVLEITETPASPVGRATAAAIMALFAAALLWSWYGRVDIHATAQGRIIAAGKTKPVGPLEDATVAAIHVKDGDHVQAGQVLVELDRTETTAEAERLRRERLEQLVTAARLRALLAGQDKLVADPAWGAPADLLALHRAQLLHKLADHRSAIGALEREHQQKKAEAQGAAAELARLVATVPLLEERAHAKETLAAEGYGARTDYLQVKQDWLDRKQQLETARHKLTEAQAGGENVEQRLHQAEEQFRADTLAQLAEADQKAASLTQEVAKAEQRDRLTRLLAPVDGVVQQLQVHAAGAVVAKTQPILMIVPEGEGIAVEAGLPNKDVGFVRPGQAVEVKVESFPFTRYGTVHGTVEVVSSDAVSPDADPTQKRAATVDPAASTGAGRDSLGALYSVRVQLAQAMIYADGDMVPLTPGMAVTAEIKTGRRRVIDYLLDPVLRYRDESFRER